MRFYQREGSRPIRRTLQLQCAEVELASAFWCATCTRHGVFSAFCSVWRRMSVTFRPMPRVLARHASCCSSCPPAASRSSAPATEAGDLIDAETRANSHNNNMAAALSATAVPATRALRHAPEGAAVEPAAQPSSFAKSIRALSSRIQPTNYNMVGGGSLAQRGVESPTVGCPGVCNFVDARTKWLDGALKKVGGWESAGGPHCMPVPLVSAAMPPTQQECPAMPCPAMPYFPRHFPHCY